MEKIQSAIDKARAARAILPEPVQPALAREAMRLGGTTPCALNAANEVAVAAFIAGKIRFGAIARLVEATMNDWIRAGNLAPLSSADDAISVDHNARNRAASLLPQIALKAS